MTRTAGGAPAAGAAAGRPGRWGLPSIAGHGRLLAAAAADSTGNGLFLAFEVLYFLDRTGLPLSRVGLALTLTHVLALPVPALVGTLVDTFDPRRVAVLGNCVSALGFAGCLAAHSFWQVVAAGLVVQTGINTYWTCSGSLVALAAGPGERTRWFGLVRALRNAGIGLGGAVSAFAVGLGGVGSVRWLVVANIASFLASAALIATWRPPRGERPAEPVTDPVTEPAATGGYLTVLRDGRFLRLVAVNLVFVLAALVLNVLLAVFLVEALHQSAWTAGLLLTCNTVGITVLQTAVTGWAERFARTRVIGCAALLYALAFGVCGALVAAPEGAVLPGLLLAVLVYTLAEMLQSPLMADAAVAVAPERLRGRYLALIQSSWSLGGATAPVLFSTLMARGPVWPWVCLVALNLLVPAALIGLDPRVPPLPARTPKEGRP
ncbi:MFS transporter [Kitasatospora sp. NPDC101176]|uniref:MFS transporter n=1 Tax=Kitasatospora sp. NPDC101176 TaxID=3364099 RepID=UPI00382BD931